MVIVPNTQRRVYIRKVDIFS